MKKMVLLMAMAALVSSNANADTCDDYVRMVSDLVLRNKECLATVKAAAPDTIDSGAWMYLPACERVRAHMALSMMKLNAMSPTVRQRCESLKKAELAKLTGEMDRSIAEINRLTKQP